MLSPLLLLLLCPFSSCCVADVAAASFLEIAVANDVVAAFKKYSDLYGSIATPTDKSKVVEISDNKDPSDMSDMLASCDGDSFKLDESHRHCFPVSI